ncbi:hypothetical protein [Nocardioides bruguierae]|uniref:Uncharacterized protein n=1 Tax=Nocardioides bruguierae TaxID=2945102 RepID=A0A9X2DA76_9ACTN|nr:hypothetical protein [Nocardioides bruguierae]MCM0622196.1 hypothetical protein [Nocardioides bruguierae]
MSLGGWVPDGVGLDELSLEVAERSASEVHLRVRNGDRYPRAACAVVNPAAEMRTLGRLWTGAVAEVTCEPCLATQQPDQHHTETPGVGS